MTTPTGHRPEPPTERPEHGGDHRDGSFAAADLLQAALALASDLDLPTVLQRFVAASANLTGAAFAAINVLDARGRSTTFVQSGVDERLAKLIGRSPHAIGVLGTIPSHGTLRLDDLTSHPSFRGFPASHPPMGAFLGTAVRVRDRVFGYLYLSEKAGGFTDDDDDIVLTLAAAAAVAIQNAQLYAASERRERWLRASQQITTMLLSGAEQEEVLAQIAASSREVANADTAALVLPGMGDNLVMEIVDGVAADQLIGTLMPPDGRAQTVLRDGNGLVVDSLHRARAMRVDAMRQFGPALYAPMQAEGRGRSAPARPAAPRRPARAAPPRASVPGRPGPRRTRPCPGRSVRTGPSRPAGGAPAPRPRDPPPAWARTGRDRTAASRPPASPAPGAGSPPPGRCRPAAPCARARPAASGCRSAGRRPRRRRSPSPGCRPSRGVPEPPCRRWPPRGTRPRSGRARPPARRRTAAWW